MSDSDHFDETLFGETLDEMLRCAFPNGVDEEAYFPLIAILRAYMSFRAVADTVANVSGKDYIYVYNDATGLYIDYPSYSDMDRLRVHLRPCGYKAWLAAGENEFWSNRDTENITLDLDHYPEALNQQLYLTYTMVYKAFNGEINGDDYKPLLAVLRDHLPSEAVVQVISIITGRSLLNIQEDLQLVEQRRPPEDKIIRVQDILRMHGYKAWLLDCEREDNPFN